MLDSQLDRLTRSGAMALEMLAVYASSTNNDQSTTSTANISRVMAPELVERSK